MFVRVVAKAELSPGEMKAVEVKGTSLVVANVEGDFHALEGTCPHADGPLGEGTLEGKTLTCEWHGWTFDVVNGQSLSDPPACARVLPVKVEGDDVMVELEA